MHIPWDILYCINNNKLINKTVNNQQINILLVKNNIYMKWNLIDQKCDVLVMAIIIFSGGDSKAIGGLVT